MLFMSLWRGTDRGNVNNPNIIRKQDTSRSYKQVIVTLICPYLDFCRGV